MAEINASEEELEQARQRFARSLKRARLTQREVELTLRESGPRRERIMRKLRRAGLVRD